MFLKVKYVMFRTDKGEGIAYPVIFSELMAHKEVASACGVRNHSSICWLC